MLQCLDCYLMINFFIIHNLSLFNENNCTKKTMTSSSTPWFHIDEKKMKNPQIAELFQNIETWITQCQARCISVVREFQCTIKENFQTLGQNIKSWLQTGNPHTLDQIFSVCRHNETNAVIFLCILDVLHFEPPCEQCGFETTLVRNESYSTARAIFWR